MDLRVPDLIEATLFSRSGQIAIALVMIAAAGYLWWRLVRGDARFENDHAWSLPGIVSPGERRWTLPAGLGPGRLPTRRDVTVAVLIALAVLATRGYRLDWPRDMYFDEVYHARTAFELLAQREPYEWTHPHLAKEIMALGILAFGDDRVVGHESVPANTSRMGAMPNRSSSPMPRASSPSSWARHTGRAKAARKCSPRWPVAASFILSITVILLIGISPTVDIIVPK